MLTVAGNGTISSLTDNNDITCAHATTKGTLANKNLTLGQDGDVFGSTRLHLSNRSGEAGAIFETTDPTVTLVDFVFKHAGGQRVLRLEGRANASPCTAPTLGNWEEPLSQRPRFRSGTTRQTSTNH